MVRARARLSTAHPIADVEDSVALNHLVGAFQQMLRIDWPEVAFSAPDDGHDVHPYLVDQPRGQHLPADVAGGDLDHAITREFLRPGHCRFDGVDEGERSLGEPAVSLP